MLTKDPIGKKKMREKGEKLLLFNNSWLVLIVETYQKIKYFFLSR